MRRIPWDRWWRVGKHGKDFKKWRLKPGLNYLYSVCFEKHFLRNTQNSKITLDK